MSEFYLMKRWLSGDDAGVFRSEVEEHLVQVWQMPRPARQTLYAMWKRDIMKEQVGYLEASAKDYNEMQSQIERAFK